MGAQYTWRDLPRDCPPDDAVAASGVVYRLVREDPPAERDLLPPVAISKKANPEACEDHALSVFASQPDAVIARQLIPGFSKRMIAEATLTPSAGVMKCSPISVAGSDGVVRFLESHHDWWVPVDAVMPAFVVVN